MGENRTIINYIQLSFEFEFDCIPIDTEEIGNVY